VPADLSTAALLFLTCLLMMFIGRVSMKYIMLLFLVGAIGMMVIIFIGTVFPDMIRLTTWTSRINEFLYTDGGYQIEQSKIAIANGGWIGVGPGNSFQRNYLPYPYADFIYSIICEEYGVVGGLFILGLYLWLLVRCIGIVTRCPKAFGAILAMGLCLNLVIQAFANIAVSVHLLPVTGLTLPLVSMGGTSILFTCMSLGIILSVSRYVEEAKEFKLELSEIEVRDADSL
jgi:cell division protein FtsW